MAAAPPRPDDTGAYRTNRPRRGGAWWWLLLALLLLAAIITAIVLIATHHHRHHKAAGVVPTPISSPTPGVGAGSGTSPLVGGGGIPAVTPTGAEAASNVAGVVLFASGSADLDSSGRQVITAAAAALKARNTTTASVTGYTDVVAGQVVNSPLSQQRATAVAAALKAVDPALTVIVTAVGQADPVASNSTDTGRAQNRRAVITATQ